MDDPFGEEDDTMHSDSEDEQELEDEVAGPPDLNEEHVLKKDKKAIMVEMERLEKLGVIKFVPLSELKGQEDKGIDWKWLTTKMVFDWRFRQGKWTRRSRLVAREFKQASQTNDVFSPATNTSLVRGLPVLAPQAGHEALQRWCQRCFLTDTSTEENGVLIFSGLKSWLVKTRSSGKSCTEER